MAKRVICECPNCHAETIVNKADVLANPLLDCPSCGAVIEVDLTPPPPPGAEEPVEEATKEPPPPTQRSSSAPGRKLMAKTAPMHAPPVTPIEATPPPAEGHARDHDTFRPAQPGMSPLMVALIAAVAAALGYVARGATSVSSKSIEGYCDTHTQGSAAEMCEHFLRK